MNRVFYFLAVIFLLSSPLFLREAKALPIIQVGCELYDEAGNLVKKFTGSMCYFKENGERLETLYNTLKYYDAYDRVVWTAHGFFHHQMKIDEERNEVAILSQSTHIVLGCPTRFDSIDVFDIATGKKKYSVDFKNLFEKKVFNIQREFNFLTKIKWKMKEDLLCDTTHVNSLYQLEKNSLSEKNSAFTKGNWLVNLSFTGSVIIFDRNFKEVLWQKEIELPGVYSHDVQLTKEDKILLYMNNHFVENDPKKVFSAIVEIDPFQSGRESIRIHEMKNDGKNFFQVLAGGIQLLPNGEKLTSVYSDTEGYQVAFLGKDWNTLRKFTPRPDPAGKFGQAFQEARFIQLNTFFKNYRGSL